MIFSVGSPRGKGTRAVMALWRRQYDLGVSRRVPLSCAHATCVFPRLLSPGIEAGIFNVTVFDLLETVEWGMGVGLLRFDNHQRCCRRCALR